MQGAWLGCIGLQSVWLTCGGSVHKSLHTAQRALLHSESQDTLGEDSELATTFFRMADRIVVPEDATSSQELQQASSVELSSVAVARAS